MDSGSIPDKGEPDDLRQTQVDEEKGDGMAPADEVRALTGIKVSRRALQR